MDNREFEAIVGMIAEYAKTAEDIRPHVHTILNTLYSYGPELRGVLSKLNIAMADFNIERYDYYIRCGIQNEFAMALTLNDAKSFIEGLQRKSSK